MKLIHKIVVYFTLSLSSFALVAQELPSTQEFPIQELPPIKVYTPENYGGENQNWMISQSENKYIYVANNKGLLEFNGERWRLYQSPNETILRSVNVIDDVIYTGCYMEFGYWTKDKFGNLNYISLLDDVDIKMLEDEQIWNILKFENWVLFQSFSRIYLYNAKSKEIKVINSKESGIRGIFKVNNQIYYQEVGRGLLKIENGGSKLEIDATRLKNIHILDIYFIGGKYLLVTKENGIYTYSQGHISKWKSPVNKWLSSVSVYSCTQLYDKGIALGTISNGIYIIDMKGQIKYHIYQANGLTNNTILSLYQDKEQNIWVGLDNGINCINITSPIRIYNDFNGKIGTVYVSIETGGYMYLGTNQGLYFKKLNSSHDSYHFIKGTKGQVWSLKYIDDKLFCGHNTGTFIIDRGNANLISKETGAWDIKLIPNRENLLLEGTYRGLCILEKKKGKWKLRNKIKKFDNSSRFLEFTKNNELLINHEYKGVFHVKLDSAYTEAISVSLDKSIRKGKNSSLISYNESLLYACREGIYRYNIETQLFKRDSIYSQLIDAEDYISAKLIIDKTNKLWAFSKNKIFYLSSGVLSHIPKINQIFMPLSFRKGMIGFENIMLTNENQYVLGTNRGYIKIKILKPIKKEYRVTINTAEALNIKTDSIYTLPLEGKENMISHSFNTILFKYSVPEFKKFTLTEYQYALEGLYDKWSKWSRESKSYFENLKFGKYILKVRARVGERIVQETKYHFEIGRPWYYSNIFLVTYLLSFLLLLILTHRFYKKYYERKHRHRHLESERLIITIKNEKLNQEIENKNKELAISTMSILKKNEMLRSIKKELEKTTSSGEEKSKLIIKLIDRNIDTVRDWEFFKEAFNNADQHFFSKIREKHPNLNPNDLKLCAYLRLNLSSKEIATLLNISVRSIEIKRYRLRKKINLTHSEGLVKYILKI